MPLPTSMEVMVPVKVDVTPAYIERVLRLPQGSFEHSLGNDPALLPLMKILENFPWMLQVAEANYDPRVAEKLLLQHCANMTTEADRGL